MRARARDPCLGPVRDRAKRGQGWHQLRRDDARPGAPGARAADRRAARVAGGAGRLSRRAPHRHGAGSPRLLTPNVRITADVSHGAWRWTNTNALPWAVTTTSRRRRAIARTICRAARGVD